jgi:hypothetical protein
MNGSEIHLRVKAILSGTDRYPFNEEAELFHVKQFDKKGGTASYIVPCWMMFLFSYPEGGQKT